MRIYENLLSLVMSKNHNKKKSSRNFEDWEDDDQLGKRKNKKNHRKSWSDEDELSEEARYYMSKIRRR